MLKNESTEMYLETILRLSERSKTIREVDLADAMKVSKVSVCKAVKRLVEKQLVTYKDHRIALTKEGRTVAANVYERHIVLTRFLVALGVSSAVAEQDACRIEHCISEETFSVIKSKQIAKSVWVWLTHTLVLYLLLPLPIVSIKIGNNGREKHEGDKRVYRNAIETR